jgi:chemotaxis protein MotB
VSYADFITLLFAFFVVMYALSSLNEGKYRILSDALENKFKSTPKASEPVQVGVVPNARLKYEVPWVENPFPENETYDPFSMIDKVGKELEHSLRGVIDDTLYKIHQSKDWLEIELKASALFQSASAQILPAAEDFIRHIAEILIQSPYSIVVEGFTDNVPIKNDIYASNWELSGARAAAVARLMINDGVPSSRISFTGYGDNFPMMNNSTPEGRMANRRIIILMNRQDKRRDALMDKKYTDVLKQVVIP